MAWSETAKDTVWKGRRQLREEVLREIRGLKDAGTLHAISIAGESVPLFTAARRPNEWRAFSEATGWPVDLLVLCHAVFYDGFLADGDPRGVQQHLEGVLSFLSVPRPGVDLRKIVPDFLVHRLGTEPWRTACPAELSDLFDDVCLMVLDDHVDNAVLASLQSARARAEARKTAAGRIPGAEQAHYEWLGLTWCHVVIHRRSAPDDVSLLGDNRRFDFTPHAPHAALWDAALSTEHEAVLQTALGAADHYASPRPSR